MRVFYSQIRAFSGASQGMASRHPIEKLLKTLMATPNIDWEQAGSQYSTQFNGKTFYLRPGSPLSDFGSSVSVKHGSSVLSKTISQIPESWRFKKK